MPSRLTAVACVTLAIAAALVTIPPEAAGHPYHSQIENNVLDKPSPTRKVERDNLYAQSFVPPTAFFVSRVSLYVQDLGLSDVLTVSIRPTSGSFPASTNFTFGFADGPATPGWLDVNLYPYVALAAGQTYWMVAQSDAPSGNGYDWWDSGTPAAYPPGTGAHSTNSGASWTDVGKDLAFRVYGFGQPSFSFDVTASAAGVAPAQSVGFRVNVTNSGPGTSDALWVNVSLPPELEYVTDDAAAVGGMRTGTYSFAFADLPVRPFSFNLTARAKGGVDDGTPAVTTFRFDPKDHNGAPLAASSRDVGVTIRNARLALSAAAGTPEAEPGDRIAFNATLTNVGSEPARNLLVGAIVDANATYVTSTPVGAYDLGTRTVRWSAPVLNASAALAFAVTVDVVAGTPDLAVVSLRASAEGEDATGTALPGAVAAAATQVHALAFAPGLALDTATAERGTDLWATLRYDNNGTATAPWVWLNWSLLGNYELLALSPALPYGPTAEGFSVPLTDVAPGPRLLAARVRVVRGMVDGLEMGMRVDLRAFDRNGNPVSPPGAVSSASLRAPSPSLTLVAPQARVSVAATFVLDLTIRNPGRASALGWLNLTLPPGVAYVGDNGSYAASAGAGYVSWSVPSLPSESHVVLEVILRREAAAGSETFRFALDFTDGRGSPAERVLSNGITVEFVVASPPGDAGFPWWIPLLALMALVPVAVAVRTRGKVEEVFLVSMGGILLAHLSRTVRSVQDREIVTAMLTAVQDFIRDAFATSREGELRELNFGRRKIAVERGTRCYLALVVSGAVGRGLQRRMRGALAGVERATHDKPDNWSEDRALVDAAGDLLSRTLL